MYICDEYNHRVRKVVVSTGIINTIAGTGTSNYSGDGGQATAATLSRPCGVNIDSNGDIFIGDYGNHRIRKITVSTGVITTVAGTGSTGYNGDSIAATSATLTHPHDVSLDGHGNLYISDRYNYRIRKVTVSTGIITTIAGTGAASSTGDGSDATSAAVDAPIYARLDSAGNLYISEFNDNGGGNRIRKVVTITTEIPTVTPSVAPTYYPSLSPSTLSIITTIAGTGAATYSGDGGAASSAALAFPYTVALDAAGIIPHTTSLHVIPRLHCLNRQHVCR